MSNEANFYEELDHFEDLDLIPRVRNLSDREQRANRYKPQDAKRIKDPFSTAAELAEQPSEQESYNFSYNASRHERVWIKDSLGAFYDGQWFDDILRLLKGGKEASVYQCLANPAVDLSTPYIAAKVYRPRRFRNLKNDHLYREGRARLDDEGHEIIDDRMNHAIEKRTDYGLNLMHTSWIEHEYQTMQILAEVGVDMPQPYARGNNAILMEYIGGDDMPAPTLNEISLDRQEAERQLEKILNNVDLMLSKGRVHGDLSAYNVLYWGGESKIIDFPQAINPAENRSAYLIFKRDIKRLCEYFIRQGVQADPRMIAVELWTANGYSIRPQYNLNLLDDQDEDDYAYWKRTASA